MNPLAELAHASMWRTGVPEDPLAARDPAFIRSQLPVLRAIFHAWHDITVDGVDNVPRGPVLAVGNHSGGVMAPDMFAVMFEWWRHEGIEPPSYGLGHDLLFRVPLVARYLLRLGGVPARRQLAIDALRRGAKVLVYPGGAQDAYRASRRKGEIVFDHHQGFIDVARRAGVRILPIVAAGAHDGFYIATDGARLARRLRLDRSLRLQVLPLGLALPWGILVGPLPYLPVPLRIRVRILSPMPPTGAEEIRATMQAALDEMNREHRWGRRLPAGRGDRSS